MKLFLLIFLCFQLSCERETSVKTEEKSASQQYLELRGIEMPQVGQCYQRHPTKDTPDFILWSYIILEVDKDDLLVLFIAKQSGNTYVDIQSFHITYIIQDKLIDCVYVM